MVDAGILTFQAIRDLCGFGPGAKEDDESPAGPVRPARFGNVRTAGYDLRVGREYYLRDSRRRGRIKTQWLDEGQTVVLAPNEVIIIRAEEQLFLSPEMVGHLSLKMDLLLRGLMMASQSQVDAGYEGYIFALLYNLSDAPVQLTRGRSFLRLELVKLVEASEQPYQGDYKNKELQATLTEHVGTSLSAMRRRVERVEGRLNRRTAFELFGVLSVVIALFVLLQSFNNEIDNVSRKQTQLTEQVKAVPGSPTTTATRVRALCKQVKRLERLTNTKPSPGAPKC